MTLQTLSVAVISTGWVKRALRAKRKNGMARVPVLGIIMRLRLPYKKTKQQKITVYKLGLGFKKTYEVVLTTGSRLLDQLYFYSTLPEVERRVFKFVKQYCGEELALEVRNQIIRKR